MPRESTSLILDLSNPDTKRKLMSHIGSLSGFYEVDIKPRKATRRLRANNFYWAALIEPFVEYLNSDGSRHFTKDMAHLALKMALIPKPVIHPKTGELIATVPGDTHTMTIGEFYDYCERARQHLLDEFGVVTLEPSDVGWHQEEVAHA